tara:strand:- start:749 stop:1459 length:711 start_codon:yes stop_codon:yes gene_type:complete
MKIRFIFWFVVFALTSLSDAAAIKIHFISGSREYKSKESLRKFIPWLEKHYDVKCSVSWGHDGIEQLPSLDELKEADLLFIFARRMKLVESQMKTIRMHWEKGKPVVGVCTASHAFQKADNEVFDRQVMGGNYQGHFGDGPVKVVNFGKHPILEGVGKITSDKLYKAGPLAKAAVVLQQGDVWTDKHAVSWINNWRGVRTFYTSLGVPKDFENENFRRMLANAIFWAVDRKSSTKN